MHLTIWKRSRSALFLARAGFFTFILAFGLAALAVSPARAATVLLDNFETDIGADNDPVVPGNPTAKTADTTSTLDASVSEIARKRIISITGGLDSSNASAYSRQNRNQLRLATASPTEYGNEYTIWYQNPVATALNSLTGTNVYLKIDLAGLPGADAAKVEVFAGTKKISADLRALESSDPSKGYITLGSSFLTAVKAAVTGGQALAFRFSGGSNTGFITLNSLSFTDSLPTASGAPVPLTTTVADATFPAAPATTTTTGGTAVTEAPTIMTSLPGLLIAGLLLHVRRRRLRG